MLTIRRVRADSDRVRERVHRHHGESDNLAGNLIVVYSRIGSSACSGVVHIAETGGQRSGAPGCIECPVLSVPHRLRYELSVVLSVSTVTNYWTSPKPSARPTLLIVTSTSSSGATGNGLLRPPSGVVVAGGGAAAGGTVVAPASTVTVVSPPITSVLLNFSKEPEKVYGPSATSEPTVTIYVNESTPTTVKVTVWPETSASITALASVLAAEVST